jgi:hypothetical protein
MVIQYLSMLYDYCWQIKEQKEALLDIGTRFISFPTLPLYHMWPTVKFISKLKSLLKHIIHIHEKDTIRLIREDWIHKNKHLLPNLDLKWCC